MKGSWRWLLRGIAFGVAGLGVVSWSGAVAAQSAPPPSARPSPEPSAAAPQACFPECRAGFVCSQGGCVSMCNPPCPQGQACVQGNYCEPQAPGAGVYEPPPPPPKQVGGFAERIHSGIAFHMAFGGELSATADDDTTETALDTTYGVNVRSDIPVVRYLLLGPLFQFGAYRTDVSPTPTRDYYLDVDLAVRGRIPIELGKVALQFWAGVPVGLTISFLGRSSSGASGVVNELSGFGVGWNIGFLLGGAIHFSRKFGMFVETGYIEHRVGHDYTNREGDVGMKLAQTPVNLGFMLYGK